VKARRAAATAASTSAGPALATSAIVSPVAGSTVENVSPLAAGTDSPSISKSCGSIGIPPMV
jgi:hypothetical protein